MQFALKQWAIVPLGKKALVGVDIFIEHHKDVEALEKQLSALKGNDLKLTIIANRGVKVWPEKMPETACVDQWRCRFVSPTKGAPVTHQQIIKLLEKLAEAKIDFLHTENLYTFDGVPGYTLSQDEQ